MDCRRPASPGPAPASLRSLTHRTLGRLRRSEVVAILPKVPLRRFSLVLAILSLSLLAPSSASAGLKGFWGPSEVSGVSQFPVYRTLGVELYQTSLAWSSIAPTRPADPRNPADPAYRWPASMDQLISEAKANGMRVLLMLYSSPAWANGGRDATYAPNAGDFGRFAEAAARRYPAVREWMIWGEPTNYGRFLPLTPQRIGRPLTPQQRKAPQHYARILDAAYVSLKRVRRSNMVIGGNTFTAGSIRPVKWAKAMRLPNGRRPRLDLYGHNPFALRTPNLKNPPGAQETVDFSDLGRFQRVIRSIFGRKTRLFLSEFAVPTGLDSEFNYYVTPQTQVRFINASFKVARQVGVYGLGWIHLYDSGPDEGGTRSGLFYANGKRKPGFNAFRRGRL